MGSSFMIVFSLGTHDILINTQNANENQKGLIMVIYGYCRISAPKQSIDKQIRNILVLYKVVFTEYCKDYFFYFHSEKI